MTTAWIGPLITALAAIFAATVAYVGSLRRNAADTAALQRDHIGEWADRFAASEQRCRDEMTSLRSQVTAMGTEVASMRGEIVRLEQLVRDLGGDPRHPDMHP